MLFFLTVIFISHSLLGHTHLPCPFWVLSFMHTSYLLLTSLRMTLDMFSNFEIHLRWHFLQDFPNPFSQVQSLPVQHLFFCPFASYYVYLNPRLYEGFSLVIKFCMLWCVMLWSQKIPKSLLRTTGVFLFCEILFYYGKNFILSWQE